MAVIQKTSVSLKPSAIFLEVDLDYLCFGIEPQSPSTDITKHTDEINAGNFRSRFAKDKKIESDELFFNNGLCLGTTGKAVNRSIDHQICRIWKTHGS